MSLSRRSVPSSRAVQYCPLCGAKALRYQRGTIRLRVGGKVHTFVDLPYERCGHCRRKIFDYSTSQVMDMVVLRGRKSLAA
ncbi:MAG: YgiT-type zinc finger protein [Nitrospirae bacterium]|nr:YgiT-type zinc finger protein [Nitrospirota bacterium]